MPFRSAFKAWIRVIALLVVLIFVPEQVSWAIGYNPGVLWPNSQPLATSLLQPNLNPPTLTNELIAENLRRSLRPLINKSLNQINFGNGLILNLGEKPRKISKDKAEIAYNWLKKPDTAAIHCGIYVLYNLLTAYNKKVSLEQLANLVLTIDILSGTVDDDLYDLEPQVKSSIFALAKAAEYFGLKLYPIKASKLDNLKPPFIAHMKAGHFVLVTKISEEKVDFFLDKGDTFLPKEKFIAEFSGFALTAEDQETAENKLISETESKSIKGASKSEYKNQATVAAIGTAAFAAMTVAGMSQMPQGFSYWRGISEPFVQGMAYRGLRQSGVNDTAASIGSAVITSFGYSALSSTVIPVKNDAGTYNLQWGRPAFSGADGWKIVGKDVLNATIISGVQQIGKRYINYDKNWGGEGLVDLAAMATAYGVGGLYSKAMNMPLSMEASPDKKDGNIVTSEPAKGIYKAYDAEGYGEHRSWSEKISEKIVGSSGPRADYTIVIKDLKPGSGWASAFWQGMKTPGLNFYVSQLGTALVYQYMGNNRSQFGFKKEDDYQAVKQVYGMAVDGATSPLGLLAEKAFKTEAGKEISAKEIGAAFAGGVAKGLLSVGLQKLNNDLKWDPFYFNSISWTVGSLAEGIIRVPFIDKERPGKPLDLIGKTYLYNADNTVENIFTVGRGYENTALGLGKGPGYYAQVNTFAADVAQLGIEKALNSYISSKLHYGAVDIYGNIAYERAMGYRYSYDSSYNFRDVQWNAVWKDRVDVSKAVLYSENVEARESQPDSSAKDEPSKLPPATVYETPDKSFIKGVSKEKVLFDKYSTPVYVDRGTVKVKTPISLLNTNTNQESVRITEAAVDPGTHNLILFATEGTQPTIKMDTGIEQKPSAGEGETEGAVPQAIAVGRQNTYEFQNTGTSQAINLNQSGDRLRFALGSDENGKPILLSDFLSSGTKVRLNIPQQAAWGAQETNTITGQEMNAYQTRPTFLGMDGIYAYTQDPFAEYAAEDGSKPTELPVITLGDLGEDGFYRGSAMHFGDGVHMLRYGRTQGIAKSTIEGPAKIDAAFNYSLVYREDGDNNPDNNWVAADDALRADGVLQTSAGLLNFDRLAWNGNALRMGAGSGKVEVGTFLKKPAEGGAKGTESPTVLKGLENQAGYDGQGNLTVNTERGDQLWVNLGQDEKSGKWIAQENFTEPGSYYRFEFGPESKLTKYVSISKEGVFLGQKYITFTDTQTAELEQGGVRFGKLNENGAWSGTDLYFQVGTGQILRHSYNTSTSSSKTEKVTSRDLEGNAGTLLGGEKTTTTTKIYRVKVTDYYFVQTSENNWGVRKDLHSSVTQFLGTRVTGTGWFQQEHIQYAYPNMSSMDDTREVVTVKLRMGGGGHWMAVRGGRGYSDHFYVDPSVKRESAATTPKDQTGMPDDEAYNAVYTAFSNYNENGDLVVVGRLNLPETKGAVPFAEAGNGEIAIVPLSQHYGRLEVDIPFEVSDLGQATMPGGEYYMTPDGGRAVMRGTQQANGTWSTGANEGLSWSGSYAAGVISRMILIPGATPIGGANTLGEGNLNMGRIDQISADVLVYHYFDGNGNQRVYTEFRPFVQNGGTWGWGPNADRHAAPQLLATFEQRGAWENQGQGPEAVLFSRGTLPVELAGGTGGGTDTRKIAEANTNNYVFTTTAADRANQGYAEGRVRFVGKFDQQGNLGWNVDPLAAGSKIGFNIPREIAESRATFMGKGYSVGGMTIGENNSGVWSIGNAENPYHFQAGTSVIEGNVVYQYQQNGQLKLVAVNNPTEQDIAKVYGISVQNVTRTGENEFKITQGDRAYVVSVENSQLNIGRTWGQAGVDTAAFFARGARNVGDTILGAYAYISDKSTQLVWNSPGYTKAMDWWASNREYGGELGNRLDASGRQIFIETASFVLSVGLVAQPFSAAAAGAGEATAAGGTATATAVGTNLLKQIGISEAIGLGVPNAASLINSGKLLPWKTNLILAGASALTPVAGRILAPLAEGSTLARIGYAAGTQAPLWGQVQLVTGQTGSILFEGRPLSAGESLKTYVAGFLYGGIFGVAATGMGALANSARLSSIINTNSSLVRFGG
ncbi:MAG: cysteine peptidase family C39 domain-containing protein, partial [Candidatus Omnitrophica bacterium]|nr:cysteine peptidase family C39 domain-containing protein [Candidatus Omnitrophota bacterium]